MSERPIAVLIEAGALRRHAFALMGIDGPRTPLEASAPSDGASAIPRVFCGGKDPYRIGGATWSMDAWLSRPVFHHISSRRLSVSRDAFWVAGKPAPRPPCVACVETCAVAARVAGAGHGVLQFGRRFFDRSSAQLDVRVGVRSG